MLPNDPVFKFVNYHLRVFVKRYCHLRVSSKIFALTLFSPDWTPPSGHNGSTPPGRGSFFKFAQNCSLSNEISSSRCWSQWRVNDLARGCITGRFLAQEWFSTQVERSPICLACWKSLKFVKHFEIFGKQMYLGYCPGYYTYSVKFSSIYLLSSNSY